MPSSTMVIAHDVDPDEGLSFSIPGLRQGDINEGTGALLIDNVQVPADELNFYADFTHARVSAFNRGTASWPGGVEATITWEGEMIEEQVAALDARITALEHMDDWFTSGELTGGAYQLKTGPGTVGRLVVSPAIIGSVVVDPAAQKPPPALLNILDGLGADPPAHPIFTIDLAQVQTTTTQIFDIHFPFETGLHLIIPGAERCLLSWR
jgi:hypothetical protein